MNVDLRAIAIHLPQFHPIPENDQWWGKGFTEWTNVTRAKPLFPGHYQPHLPADLGFYDLRLAEARIAQATLAREYGIYGFCYYHYWFNGKRLLERPVNEIVVSGEPDFPFMLCWANENWSRRWDGSEDVVLMKQDYSLEDARQHCEALMVYFQDDRYIKIAGKPVFAFYKPELIPDTNKYIDAFRQHARTAGIELYLCAFETMTSTTNLSDSFDAAVEFQPHSKKLPGFMQMQYKASVGRISNKLFRKLLSISNKKELVKDILHKAKFHLEYGQYVDYVLSDYQYPQDYVRFPGVTPMWDNTARRGNKAFMLNDSTPEKYAQWLGYHTENFKPYSQEENFIFINAWNEWAEGNHLEPCLKWGTAYLEATKSKLQPTT